MRSLLFGLVLVPALAHADGWTHGDHLTGEWGGTRSELAHAGLTVDVDALTNPDVPLEALVP